MCQKSPSELILGSPEPVGGPTENPLASPHLGDFPPLVQSVSEQIITFACGALPIKSSSKNKNLREPLHYENMCFLCFSHTMGPN